MFNFKELYEQNKKAWDEYFSFISTEERTYDDDGCENHHIFPKSLEPALKDSPWNIVRLRKHDHLIDHAYLLRLTKSPQMAWAFKKMYEEVDWIYYYGDANIQQSMSDSYAIACEIVREKAIDHDFMKRAFRFHDHEDNDGGYMLNYDFINGTPTKKLIDAMIIASPAWFIRFNHGKAERFDKITIEQAAQIVYENSGLDFYKARSKALGFKYGVDEEECSNGTQDGNRG